MVYRLSGGIYFVLIGLGLLGVVMVPTLVTGVLALVAGIALLAGQ